MTSPEEPAIIVGRLKHKFSSQSVLLGHYSVSADEVSGVTITVLCSQLLTLGGGSGGKTSTGPVTVSSKTEEEQPNRWFH